VTKVIKSMRQMADTLKNEHGFDVKLNSGSRPGMAVRCENGNYVSVQWGDGNYCANRDRRWLTGQSDCVDAEVAIWDADGVWHRIQEWDDVIGGQTPEQVEQWVRWAAENEVVPKPQLPSWSELERLVSHLKAEIRDEYRASEDDDEPGVQLTVGWDGKKDWSAQSGDNSFTGGAYGYQYWAVVSVYRDTKTVDLVGDICDQLEEVSDG
jgi:hypothetical protein